MQIHQFFKAKRKELRESQTQFYDGILARGTANKFENGNDGLLKVKHIPYLLEHIGISFDEFSFYCNPSFDTNFDKFNNRFLEITQLISDDSIGVISLSKETFSELITEIESIYTKTIEKKNTHTNYLNLNILIRATAFSFSSKIFPVDKTEIAYLKKIYKNKQSFSKYDYKIFANMLIIPGIKHSELLFLEELLFPMSPNSDQSLTETAHLALSNLVTLFLRSHDFKNAHKYLDFLNKNLASFPSYRYKLIYLHDISILEFLESNYTAPEALASAFQYVDIIAKCEPKDSTFGNRMREAAVNLIEKNSETKDIVAMIASAKNDIDFTKNIPPHLIKK